MKAVYPTLFSFFLLLIAMSLLGSCNKTSKKEIPLDNGVPKKMAEFRKKQLSNIEYALKFDIPKRKKDSIPAELVLNLEIHDTTTDLFLDFKQDTNLPVNIVINDKNIPVAFRKEHLIISKEFLKKGKNKIHINFIAGDMSLNRNEDYLYTLLVPDRARTLFPCFDQPDLKAAFDLKINAPKGWSVIAGSPLKSKIERKNFTEHQFEKTDLMSTYLFSFVVGKFKNSTKNGKHFFYRETNKDKCSESIPEIFNIHEHAIGFLENYTSSKLPFQKLDFAAIPGFQYGGMEHVGAIQYRESLLFLDSTATQNRKISRAKLIAHEVSHMWFGNLVTMKWFNDVWMKEVFANLMADKIVSPLFPEVDHNLEFMMRHYPSAYAIDRTQGANAMRQNLDNLNNAGSLYGSIIYNKAPIMMRQLETLIGSKKFQEGLTEYLKKYANKNADWNDLIQIVDKKTLTDLKKWSKVWVHSSGRPLIREHISYDKKKHIKGFEISQIAEDKSTKIWPQTFDISLIYKDSTHNITVNLENQKTTISKAIGLPKPQTIIYNANGLGYGVFPTEITGDFSILNIENVVSRGQTYINIFENCLNGNLSPITTSKILEKGFENETNELILQRISSYLKSIFWKYLTEEERNTFQISLEKKVYKRLLKKESPKIQKIIFGLFSSIGYSESGKEVLYKIWNKEILIPNLKLNTDNYTSIAMTLCLYKHPQSKEILEKSRAQIKNPDKLKRYDFLVPSVSQNSEIRTQFFTSFKKEKNREKESWVVSACQYLHHPLQQNIAIGNLHVSLDLIEEIQKTGDIFFPKRWLQSTIGQYTSKEALQIVTQFLETHPNLNPQLKMKILQATDNLFRVQKTKIQ